MIINKIARKIASSIFFWRIRHLFQPNWIISYEDKDSSYILDIVKKYKCKTILDFGCASGKTLEDIKDLSPNDFHVYGIDINNNAIKFCKNKFADKYDSGFMFNNKFDSKSLNEFLVLNKKKVFDLIIFDRVLYCMDDKTLWSFFANACSFANMIFIDDFDCENTKHTNEYKHRDWSKLLAKYNFKLISKTKTCYQKVERASAKSMIFKLSE